MKIIALVISLPLAIGAALPGAAWGASTDEAHVHANSTDPMATRPAPSQRYATDAPLREGMSRIRAAISDLRHYEMGHMPEAIAAERVGEIKSAIDYLFANCKLPDDADAALHTILAPLLGAVHTFEKDPEDLASIARMRDAVDDYPHRFDDPSWSLPANSTNNAGH